MNEIERREFLARVAAAHDVWIEQHLDDVPFDPESRPESEDYNLWHVDMDAPGEVQDQFFAMLDSEGDTSAEDDDDGEER